MRNQESTTEEVDLGQLFRLIGNGFNKLFHFIISIFNKLFHFIVLFLQFIRKHFLKFAIAAFLGIAIGWYLDKELKPIYSSAMIIQPNFDSVLQIYNNVEFYNELVDQKDYTSLSEVFRISIEEARTIKQLSIEPFSDQTQKIKEFNEFINEIDTTSLRLSDYNYEDFVKNYDERNSKFHRVIMISTNSEISKKCENVIIESLEKIDHFRLMKQVNDVNLVLSDSIIKKQMTSIDSLQEFYKKIKILELNKPSSTTSISLGENESNSIFEVELFDRIEQLKNSKISLNNKKASTKNIINIISGFPNKATSVNNIVKKNVFMLPIIFMAITFAFLVTVLLNKFLKNYNKK
ncbi:hypothetical protein [Aquimarina sp. 2201CG14-23]|uniref:hypothetical protein n=1 Tax=Aquimarina mycalae TaxID=3040073 RepID=UPI002477E201|nr:hypothetical protein [Aquimarina sp. 2201CG14-23]MDH7446357.1 hypothetical protein [Aquimarina sp. 2201CG14-23]